jgi:hypothetical protein
LRCRARLGGDRTLVGAGEGKSGTGTSRRIQPFSQRACLGSTLCSRALERVRAEEHRACNHSNWRQQKNASAHGELDTDVAPPALGPFISDHQNPTALRFDGLPLAANRTHHSMNIVMTVWRRSKENFVAKASS